MSDEQSGWDRYRNAIGVSVILGGLLAALLFFILFPAQSQVQVNRGSATVDCPNETVQFADGATTAFDNLAEVGRNSPNVQKGVDACQTKIAVHLWGTIGIAALSAIGGAIILALPRQSNPSTSQLPSTTAQSPSGLRPDDTEARLRKVDDLERKALIGADEAKAKRLAIIDEL